MPTAICENCKLVFNDDETTTCPDCESHTYDYPDENLTYCPNKSCDLYLQGQDTTSPHCKECSTDSKKTRLYSADDLDSLVVVPEKTLTKADRQLKDLIEKAAKFVSGSGTHHRSTGGTHTSTATEKHSGAMKGKKQVREKYIERLNAAIEAASDKSLQEEGAKMVGAMKSK